MKVWQLIEELECCDPESMVRLAIQPSYPFEHTVSEVVEANGKAYIAEGSQENYLSAEVRDMLGW